MQQNLMSDQWLCARAILAPENKVVNRINADTLMELQERKKQYLSMDTIMERELSTLYTVKFLNYLELTGVSSHKLQLKLNVPIMFMLRVTNWDKMSLRPLY